MHIKQLIIEGFKTYKERTILEPFHPLHNCILGPNGSGKSNLLDAIQFVLSDKYSQLRSDERQRLLYEGAGREILSASVEVIFDNSDHRFPTDRDEVSIKRTIGLKKDEYFLDAKHLSKQEVQNFLESAGISRSNPYNIVQQGKISQLIKMKDNERLELLKEIAGTRTYDDRRKESQKIIKDTDARMTQTDETIAFLSSRLAELNQEKKELSEFTKLDNERRALEYTLYEKELKSASEKLESIDKQKNQSTGASDSSHKALETARQQRLENEEKIIELENKLEKLHSAKKRAVEARKSELKKQAEAHENVSEMEIRVKRGGHDREAAKKEAAAIEKEIKSTEKLLAAAESELAKRNETEANIRAQITRLEQRTNDLIAKKGRSQQFSSKKDRDSFIRKQLKELVAEQKKVESLIAEYQSNTEFSIKESELLQSTVENRQSEIDQLRGRVESVNKRLADLESRRNETIGIRKEAQREENQLEASAELSAMEKAQRALESTMDRELLKGLQFIKSIRDEGKIPGIHGPLIDLFETSMSQFDKAVEITAGNALFNVVVDDDEVASKLIRELNKSKAGRVTLIPLNRLKEQEHAYPKASDCLPMIDKLKFNSKYRPAIDQVFGRTLVARDLQVASQVSAQYGFNTITLNGDRVDKKGALTGGYFEMKVSRLEQQKKIVENRKAQETRMAKKGSITEKIQKAEKELSAIQEEIEKLSAEKSSIRESHSVFESDIKAAKKMLATNQQSRERNEKLKAKLKLELTPKAQQIESLESELKSEMERELDENDEEELNQVHAELRKLNQELMEATKLKLTSESEKSKFESALNMRLKKRFEELIHILSSPSIEDETETLKREKIELKTLDAEVKEIEGELKKIDNELDSASAKLRELQNAADQLKSTELQAQHLITEESREIELLLGKRSTFIQKRDDCQRKIRDLGSLPTDHSRHAKKNVNQLLKELENINEKLKKYSHVNKKALEQFAAFTEQQEDILKRKQETHEGRKAILALIEHLDQKKDEAIDRTFKQIGKYFSEVYSELVPGGKGRIVIKTREPKSKKAAAAPAAGRGRKRRAEEKTEEEELEEQLDDDDEDEDDELRTEAGDKTLRYTGVGIEVSFKGGSSETHQLSGGQESVVALSLIFAIQRCDPSPFYLFDEIDAALDPVHRTAVAKMIEKEKQKKDSPTTQFITTTFGAEMIEHSDKFYGVIFQNKVSIVNVISKEEALELIKVEDKNQSDNGSQME